MSYLSLLSQTCTRFYSPESNGVDWENYSVEALDCRWQNHVEMFQNSMGENWDSKAIVYSTSTFDLEDWLYLGTTSETDPRELENCYRIKLKYITQTPSADIIVYKYILS